jgi:predicted  nucleic acid-binding Zn-ribbon protein
MSVVEQLLAVQEHDVRIMQIEKAMKDIPARKERELERLNGHKAALAKAEEALKAQQAKLKQLEGDTQAKQEKIAKLRGQQLSLKTNKEFKAMETEIKTIEDSIGADEDRELVIMQEIEEARSGVEASAKELAEEDAEVQEDIKDLDERLSILKSELETEKAARAESVQGIDPVWLTRYENILKSKSGNALVSSANGVCGGCHMTLPPYLKLEAKKQLDMVVCSYCGRMLY